MFKFSLSKKAYLYVHKHKITDAPKNGFTKKIENFFQWKWFSSSVSVLHKKALRFLYNF